MANEFVIVEDVVKKVDSADRRGVMAEEQATDRREKMVRAEWTPEESNDGGGTIGIGKGSFWEQHSCVREG